MQKYLLFTAGVASFALLTACDSEADELTPEEWAETQVSPRCSTNGQHHFSGPLIAHSASPSLSASMTNSSPSASYGGKSCGDHYVIEATNVDNFWIHPHLLVSPFWAGPPLTQSQCAWTVLFYDVSIFYDGAWHQRVATFDTGSWDGTKCVIGGPVEIYDPNKEAEKVQVAVKAVYLDGSGEHTGKVGASVIRTSILLGVS
ncbi:hypothetical protein [Nannocystis pusilla]|uniref:hypothetical protein n=1 Tax=Nannocystis pusilla TaxID=889268 RepID=UPI003BF25DD4